MDFNKKIQSFLTPVNISGLDGILNITCKRSPYSNLCDYQFPCIFSLLNLTPYECFNPVEDEQEVIVKPIVKQLETQTTVETRTIGTQYSVNDYDDWIVVRDNNN